MKNFKELKKAIAENKPMVWKDPEPIKGNDYTITYIEDVENIEDDEDPRGYPILIQYGGSEAEVFLSEIKLK